MKIQKKEQKSFPTPIRTLLTVRQFTEKHPFISESGLRYHIFNAQNNGLVTAGAIVRLGRRVLFDEENFFNWIENNQTNNSNKVGR